MSSILNLPLKAGQYLNDGSNGHHNNAQAIYFNNRTLTPLTVGGLVIGGLAMVALLGTLGKIPELSGLFSNMSPNTVHNLMIGSACIAGLGGASFVVHGGMMALKKMARHHQ